MDNCVSRVLDSMDRDGFVRILSRFGQIYESGKDHGTLERKCRQQPLHHE
jgi:hypothetical protein